MTTLDSRAFNIGTSVETDVLELAGILKRTGKSDVAVNHAPARAGEQMRSAVQIAKAKRALGWEPRVALEEGLANTFEWFAMQRSGARS